MSNDHFSDQELKLLEKKKRFLVDEDTYEDIKLMRDSEVTLLMYSIFDYVIHGIIPELDGEDQRLVKGTFNRFKKQHKVNLKDWLEGRLQKSRAGIKSAEARAKQKAEVQ